nr:AAA family ATPase [uncultured Albidiferax sp.]
MSTRRDYSGFLTWLHGQADVSDDAKRIANTVYVQFESIEKTSSNKGERSRLLTPLLTANFAGIDAALPAIAAGDGGQARSWVRLAELKVGPFRGFRQEETFDLTKRVILVYGQNGTGKTSFCEALEHAMLGIVEEAALKRIDHDAYLRNVHEKKFVPPKLKGRDVAGNDVPIQSNPDAHRFCFVEKNRIEDFARMSAKTPAQRTELIARLFGMQGFSDFIGNFNADLSNDLTLDVLKGQRLEEKRRKLASDTALVANKDKKVAELNQREEQLTAKFKEGAKVADLYAAIGREGLPGRLQALDEILSAPLAAENGATVAGLEAAREAANAARRRLTQAEAALNARRSEVNFKALYEAVKGLEFENLDHCPACLTPLDGDPAVKENPYARAHAGLAQLEALAGLEREKDEAQAQCTRTRQALGKALARTTRVATALDVAPLRDLLSDEDLAQDGTWWTDLEAAIAGAHEGRPQTPWDLSRNLAWLAEEADGKTRTLAAERKTFEDERAKLRALEKEADGIATLRTQYATDQAQAETNIANFNMENAQLIADAANEKMTIAGHEKISTAYSQFRKLLVRYRSDLPRALTADLGDTTRTLFNLFNQYDIDADKLAKLLLPTNADGAIQLAFNSHPNDLQDALQVLSEGHVRCLGLAILVAKNIKENCPLLIFDDAVNAIDDEHRLGIRDTLFDNADLAAKQIIVTCHGEELIKDIENALGYQNAGADCQTYTFHPHNGNRYLRVEAAAPRNYILEAQGAVAAGRIRSSLGSARRATEAVTSQTWRFLKNKGLGELSLKLDRHGGKIELNNLATQLKKAIDTGTFTHPRKANLSEGFAAMLDNRHWQVINAGTHEEAGRPDFPRELVTEVVSNLAMLDDVLSGRLDAALRAVA